jgi:hypothetical protein
MNPRLERPLILARIFLNLGAEAGAMTSRHGTKGGPATPIHHSSHKSGGLRAR